MKKNKLRFILASQSPRRKEILKAAGFKFTTLSSNSSESFDENLTLPQNLQAIVREKMRVALSGLTVRKKKDILLLTADTVVIHRGTPLGKPLDRHDAARMLRLLSGKTHSVWTAFFLYRPDLKLGVTRIVKTQVTFRKLSKAEITWYVNSREPFDKAGSYGIQGRGSTFVKQLRGDLQNVIGLPLFAIKQELDRRRWIVDVKRQTSSRSAENK